MPPYHLTQMRPGFTSKRKSLATPVILKDGTVAGWGSEALKRRAHRSGE
jgi:hypothetical protein